MVRGTALRRASPGSVHRHSKRPGSSASPATQAARSCSAASHVGDAAWLARSRLGRRWHFFFAWAFVANLLVYLVAAIAGGHFWRDLLPARHELRPRSLLKDIADHLRLKLPRGEAARHYNPLQKLSYLGVIGVLLPLMILTGLTMSPGMDAIFPWLVDLFGGRQSARTVHFIAASLIVLFVFVHVAMVLLAGPLNELRSMITGRFAIFVEDDHA
jgi:thiosulfate reductase cytochrome b subunit